MPVFNNMLAGASGGAGAGYEIERSLRFNSGDSAFLNRNFGSSGNRRTYTISFWIKLADNPSGDNVIAGHMVSGFQTQTMIRINNLQYLEFGQFTGSWNFQKITQRVFRDFGAWYHIVWSVDTTLSTAEDRIKLYVNGVRETAWSTNTNPSQNLETLFNSNVEHAIGKSQPVTQNYGNYYLADTHFIDGQALAPTDFGETDEFGVWQPKKFAGSYTLPASGSGIVYSSLVSGPTSASPYEIERAFDGNLTTFGDHSGANTTWTFTRTFTSVTSLRVYIHGGNSTNTVTTVGGNGTQTDTISTDFGPGWHTISLSNTGSTINSIAFTRGGSGNPLSVYAIEVNGTVLVDGTPAQGANSFHLPFTDNSSNAALGTDTSGNSNTWTVNNLSVAAGAGNDSLVDTPTNGTQTDTGAGGEVVGNYATLNPLHASSPLTLANGNLYASNNAESYKSAVATIGVNTGKWYWEVTCTSVGFVTSIGIGNDMSLGGLGGSGNISYHYDGTKYISGANSSYGASYSSGDILGFALDMDSGTLECFKNNASQGNIATGLTGTYFPRLTLYGTHNVTYNFGQRAFAYPVSGYKALCTANLPDPTIADGSDYFQTKIFTGNGSSTVLTTGFSPDMVWLKSRASAFSHYLGDIVRGSNKLIQPNSTAAEITTTSGISSFNSDGVTLGSGSETNANNDSMVAWIWDAGTSTVSNTDGTITSQVRAQPSAGFSIVSWSGTGSNATVGHGLNAQPGFVIVKNRSSAGNNWIVWVTGFTGPQGLYLNSTTGQISDTGNFTAVPTSSVLNLGSGGQTNGSSNNMSAYCFAPVEGYSAMGSYVGNGSADGVFVHTGFKIAYLLIKCTSHASMWSVWDATRDVDNPSEHRIRLDQSNAEESGDSNIYVDLLSNGFKTRAADTDTNGSGRTYIYLAVAENPFKNARAR